MVEASLFHFARALRFGVWLSVVTACSAGAQRPSAASVATSSAERLASTDGGHAEREPSDPGSCPLHPNEPEPMPGGVAEHTHACDAGNAEACDDAGTDWRLGRAKPQSDVRAVALYRRACDGGSDAGCSNLALAYRSGAGVDVDYELSKRLYSQACEHGFAQACAGMGDMYEHQIPEARDPVQAAKFYERACTLGDAIGCAALGEMYQLGHGVPRTPRKSLELYLLACRCRNAYGCAHGADLAAGLGKNEIADALYRGAAALNQAGCDDGDPYDCSLLGDQYRDGKGVPRDRDRALRLYTFGCQRHMTAGCDGLRSLLELQTDAPSPRD